MPNTQNLRRRIKSISNTRQITKAMELVAAAKMRKAQSMAISSRDYSRNASEILYHFAFNKLKKLSKFYRNKINQKTGLLVVITSDKGLAGSYNSLVIKSASKLLSNSDIKYKVLTIGKKATDYFSKLDIELIASFTNISFNRESDASPIIKIIIDSFTKNNTDRVDIVYTKFISTVKQEACIEQVLPLIKRNLRIQDVKIQDNIFEPNEKIVFDTIVPRFVGIIIYQTLLESQASEHSARMVAMKNASDNASDIVDDLKLTYNSVRQAIITQELAEISAGAGAL